MPGKNGGKRPGAGRKPGAVSAAKRQLSEMAQEYGGMALATLAEIARGGESESARVSASQALLDRGYGKPPQSLDVGLDATGGLAEFLAAIAERGRRVHDR